ncbi:NAD-dependent epimerase/dehydratase family protein [Thermobifida halotolerans]|uniref:NAD-dependent epimerase/dehydratase family protein n=1 Tax=Thermobifida halotolerans TaxID=483545 RepID=A0A399G6R9_9ACTN|nr:NAD-dependent epimerase/dehydratase family protein [Thermobifida halotolerans]UOE20803.1 NAD-dependent epimerase/dehydratase family protein [Thermobifida halotolerans]
MRALVTGGAGFIGSHLADSLLAHGHDVVVLDDLSTGSRTNLVHVLRDPRARFVHGSVLDDRVLRAAMADRDTVFHLAAPVGARIVGIDPVRTVHVNVTGTERVLAAALERGCRLLFASGGEVYGRSDGEALREDDDRILGSAQEGRWCTAVTKGLAEYLVTRYAHEYGMPAVIARLFDVTGPRQSADHGHVLPAFVEQALHGRPITVHGDGSQSRCFCSVHDAVAALLALVDQPLAHGRAVNIGATRPTTVLELARRVSFRTGSASGIVTVEHRVARGPHYAPTGHRVPDTALAASLIGWQATTDLDTIIDETIAHHSAPAPPLPLFGGDLTV